MSYYNTLVLLFRFKVQLCRKCEHNTKGIEMNECIKNRYPSKVFEINCHLYT